MLPQLAKTGKGIPKGGGIRLSPGDELAGELRLHEGVSPFPSLRTYPLPHECDNRRLKTSIISTVGRGVISSVNILARGTVDILQRFFPECLNSDIRWHRCSYS